MKPIVLAVSGLAALVILVGCQHAKSTARLIPHDFSHRDDLDRFRGTWSTDSSNHIVYVLAKDQLLERNLISGTSSVYVDELMPIYFEAVPGNIAEIDGDFEEVEAPQLKYCTHIGMLRSKSSVFNNRLCEVRLLEGSLLIKCYDANLGKGVGEILKSRVLKLESTEKPR